MDAKDPEPEEHNLSASEIKDAMQRQPEGKPLPSSVESTHSPSSSSSKGDNDSNSIEGCEICWEDLHLGEGIGQGKEFYFYSGAYSMQKN